MPRIVKGGWLLTALKYESLYESHGRFFKNAELPKGIRRGGLMQCFKNSYNLLKSKGNKLGLIYVEGYAVSSLTNSQHIHAWCVDLDGNVYDRTWSHGVLYFGVGFKRTYVLKTIESRKKEGEEYFGFLDDWEKDFPLIKSHKKEIWRYDFS